MFSKLSVGIVTSSLITVAVGIAMGRSTPPFGILCCHQVGTVTELDPFVENVIATDFDIDIQTFASDAIGLSCIPFAELNNIEGNCNGTGILTKCLVVPLEPIIGLDCTPVN
ncbi:hypothetical protein C8R44DRAFT_892159 [Mycena epipterygia]|nr:hypothetical protein C8R44DRAFT_892159 [Mycena epipterygia]